MSTFPFMGICGLALLYIPTVGPKLTLPPSPAKIKCERAALAACTLRIL